MYGAQWKCYDDKLRENFTIQFKIKNGNKTEYFTAKTDITYFFKCIWNFVNKYLTLHFFILTNWIFHIKNSVFAFYLIQPDDFHDFLLKWQYYKHAIIYFSSREKNIFSTNF